MSAEKSNPRQDRFTPVAWTSLNLSPTDPRRLVLGFGKVEKSMARSIRMMFAQSGKRMKRIAPASRLVRGIIGHRIFV